MQPPLIILYQGFLHENLLLLLLLLDFFVPLMFGCLFVVFFVSNYCYAIATTTTVFII